jgi:hypothetical protein
MKTEKKRRLIFKKLASTGLLGVMGKYVNEDAKITVKDSFFYPYPSPASFIADVASIPASPLFHTGLSVYYLLEAGLELSKTLVNLIRLHPTEAKENLKDSKKHLVMSLISLIYGAISPIINLIGVICSSIATVKPAKNEELPRECDAQCLI